MNFAVRELLYCDHVMAALLIVVFHERVNLVVGRFNKRKWSERQNEDHSG